MRAYTRTHPHSHTHTHTIHTHTHMHTHARIHTRTHVYTHTHICAQALHVYTLTHVYTHMHTCIHTCTHTHMRTGPAKPEWVCCSPRPQRGCALCSGGWAGQDCAVQHPHTQSAHGSEPRCRQEGAHGCMFVWMCECVCKCVFNVARTDTSLCCPTSAHPKCSWIWAQMQTRRCAWMYVCMNVWMCV